MADDELDPSFEEDPSRAALPVAFRQGTVLSWNQIDATNTVLVGRSTFTNMPILASSAEVMLMVPGDTVGIQVVGTGASAQMYIIGRITAPGTAQAATALNMIGMQYGEVLTQHSTTSTSWTDLTGGPSVTVYIRPSGRVQVFFAAQIGWAISASGAVGGKVAIDVSGANTFSATGTANTNQQIRAQIEAGGATTNTGIFGTGSIKVWTGLSPGNTTFKLRYLSTYGQSVDFDNRILVVIPL